jgi:O-antigen/teichoic acid export membrane protein
MVFHSPRRLLANAGSNTAAFVVYLAASFILAPIVLRSLGDERYGAWSFVESFVAYLTLFDLGVAAALVRFVPRCVATDDFDRLNRTYSASLTFFSIGAVIALIIGGVFEWTLLDQVLPSAAYAGEIRWLFRLLVLNFAISLPMSVYPAMLDGLGRFVFKSSVRSAVVFVRVPLTIYALTYEQRLIALGLVITGCQLLEQLILALGTWRIIPQLRFHPWQVDRGTIREVAGYSGAAFVAMMAGRLSFHTDAFVIGPILGPAAITLFAVPAKLVEMARTALRQATTTLTGAFSALEAAGQHDQLRQTFVAGSRAAWFVAMPFAVGLICLGPAFLQLWIKSDYRPIFAHVLWVLAPLIALTIAQSVASRVLYGTGDLRAFAWAAIGEGVANLGFSLLFIRPFGVVGVAIGTAIPHAVFCMWVILRVVAKLNVCPRSYMKGLNQAVVASLLPALVWAWAGYNGIASWWQLLLIGIVGGCIYGSAYAVVTGAWRRLTKPIGRLATVPLPMRRAG